MRYLLLTLGVCCAIAIVNPARAQANPAVNGITISPIIEQITLSPSQTSATFETQVTNNTNSGVVITVGAQDFTALNQSGAISFYNSSPIRTSNPHGLLDYLSIGYPQIALQPHQSQAVPITILNANKLAVGGHYAALLFKAANLNSAKGNQVTINQVVSSLVFLSTYGQGTQTTDLTTPVVGSITTSFPQAINAVFGNNGNTQTTPRGVVQILNSSSAVVSQGQINIDSGLILPQSKRLFNLTLSQTKKRLWPGIYRLRVYYRHDGQTTYRVYEQKFLFVNRPIIIAAIVVILLLLALVARFFLPAKLPYRLKQKP